MKKIIIIIFLLIFTGCSKTIYIPVESVKTEYRNVLQRDSIYILDSVFMSVKGDTVYKEKYKTIYKDKLKRDSIHINDTIRIPYPVDKIVEVNKLNWFQKISMYGFTSIIVGLIIWFLIKIKVWKRF